MNCGGKATDIERELLTHAIIKQVYVRDGEIIAIEPLPDFHALLAVALDESKTMNLADTEATGFEPAISALTGLHVRPLHHASSKTSTF